MTHFEKKHVEIAAGTAAAVASVAAVAAVTYYRRRRTIREDVLETTKLSTDKHARLNGVAAYILTSGLATRAGAVEILGISTHHASQALSYLRESELAMRARSEFTDGHVIKHYVATESLQAAASDDGLEHIDLVENIDRLIFGDQTSDNS